MALDLEALLPAGVKFSTISAAHLWDNAQQQQAMPELVH